MRLREFYCDTCDFEMPAGFGEYRYVETDDGEQKPVYHPGEILDVLRVLGEDASEELIDERTGYIAYYACRDCAATFEAERDSDPQCPACESDRTVTANDLVGEGCPSCEDGTFVDETTGVA